MLLANSLKAAGIEVYVVAFHVCGTLDQRTKPTCGNIGNSDADSIADRRLLKCISNSLFPALPAPQDLHYQEVKNASDLQPAFTRIAFDIVGHGLTTKN
jgi:hypothetical protein